jgi:hypothetical protein
VRTTEDHLQGPSLCVDGLQQLSGHLRLNASHEWDWGCCCCLMFPASKALIRL